MVEDFDRDLRQAAREWSGGAPNVTTMDVCSFRSTSTAGVRRPAATARGRWLSPAGKALMLDGAGTLESAEPGKHLSQVPPDRFADGVGHSRSHDWVGGVHDGCGRPAHPHRGGIVFA